MPPELVSMASMQCSFVSPEAPLMVLATIIFLFWICLGGLINLLRIHYSIYQNNGTLFGNQHEENDIASRFGVEPAVLLRLLNKIFLGRAE